MILSALRERLIAEFGIQERPFSDLSIVPNHWQANLTRRYWRRLIPPAKYISMQAPDIADEEEVSPDLLLRICLKLRIKPSEFGLPWN